jgi:hypothetical protein
MALVRHAVGIHRNYRRRASRLSRAGTKRIRAITDFPGTMAGWAAGRAVGLGACPAKVSDTL